MNFVVDAIIVVIFLLCVFLGYKKGLIGTAFSMASFILAAIIAAILFNPLASFLTEKTDIDENIKTMFINNFSKESNTKQDTENVPDVIVNYIEEKATEIRNNGVEAASENIAQICVKGLSFLSIFIVATIVISIIGKVADVLAKLPVLKQFNAVGGIAIGALKGLIIIYVALALLTFMVPVLQGTGVYSAINDSYVAKYMYDNNLLLKIMF